MAIPEYLLRKPEKKPNTFSSKAQQANTAFFALSQKTSQPRQSTQVNQSVPAASTPIAKKTPPARMTFANQTPAPPILSTPKPVAPRTPAPTAFQNIKERQEAFRSETENMPLVRAKRGLDKFGLRSGAYALKMAADTMENFTSNLLRNPDKFVRKLPTMDNLAKSAENISGLVMDPASTKVEKPNKIRQEWQDFADTLLNSGYNPSRKAKEAIDKLLDESAIMQPDKDWQESSTTEKLTSRLPQTLYELGPSVAASFAFYGISRRVGIASTVGSTAQDIEEIAIENGKTESEAEDIGLATGIPVAALESLVPAKLFGGKAAKEVFIKGFHRRLADQAIKLGLTGFEEALTEVGQELISITAESTLREDLTLGEGVSRVALSGVMGFFGGAGLDLSIKVARSLEGRRVPGLSIEDVSGKDTTQAGKDAEKPVSEVSEDKKYARTFNIKDKDDLKYLGRILSESQIEDIKKGKMTNFRGTRYADLAKVNIISETPKTTEEKLSGKIKEVKLKSDTFYHGTSAENARGIMQTGFKRGSELPETTFRGGGYGQMQSSISLAETPKEASIFSKLTRDGEIVEAKLKPDAKVVTIDGVEDAVELNDYIDYLKKEKIDAVYIGGGEQELAVIDPKAIIPTKSQLTDNWNKAQTKTPSKIQPTSAVEFVENAVKQDEQLKPLISKIRKSPKGDGAFVYIKSGDPKVKDSSYWFGEQDFQNGGVEAMNELVGMIKAEKGTTEKGIFYTGQNGEVSEHSLDMSKQKTVTLKGDQRNIFGVKTYPEADQKLIDKYGEEYDFVILEHPEQPQKATEYFDLKDVRWYSQDKATAESYAMQSRGEKYAKNIAVPPKKTAKTKTSKIPQKYTRGRELVELKEKKKTMLDEFLKSEQGEAVQTEAELNSIAKVNENPDVVSGVKNNPFYKKEKFVLDDMGVGWLMERKGRQVVVEPDKVSEYEGRGYRKKAEIDSLAQEAGFETGQDYLEEMLVLSELKTNARNIADDLLASQNKEYGEVKEKLGEMKQELRGEMVTAEALLSEAGKVSRTKERRRQVSAIRDYFGLTDKEIKQINRRDISNMPELEFAEFLKNLEVGVRKFAETKLKRDSVVSLIQERELQKTENLQKAMKLPPIEKMNDQQLDQFFEALLPYKQGDVFLPARRMQVLQKTKLEGVKTWREVREKLSQETGKPLEVFGGIVATEFDRFRYDSLLAQQNPLYKVAVEEVYTEFANAEIAKMKRRDEVNKLAKAARKSRRRGVRQRIAPIDERVIEWLESDNKVELAENMTPAELEYAVYLKQRWQEMYDYLAKVEALSHKRENYYAHIRRGFLETVRDDGFIKAIRGISKQNEVDRLAFEILDSQTGEILAFEKFFGNAQKRTGKLVPTKDSARSFLTYVNSFETKRALDQVTVLVDTYVQASTPQNMTQGGLLLHGDLKRFWREWLNNKRGRKTSFGGVLKQGGKLDRSIRLLRAATTVKDLGFSLPGGLSAIIGEQVVTYKKLGNKKFALGKTRRYTKQGRKIREKYKSFVGESVFEQLTDVSNTLGQKTMSAMFGLFSASSRMANTDFLLGSLTKQEYESGEISAKRLAELKLSIGTFRQVSGMQSVFGATSVGSAVNQYKGWAIPILTSTAKNVGSMAKQLKKGDVKGTIKSDAFQEEFRGAIATVLLVLLVGHILDEYEEKDGLVGEFVRKAKREVLTLYQALGPDLFFTTPRVITWLDDFGQAIKQLYTLEKYADGKLKAPKSFERLTLPAAVKQALTEENYQDKKEAIYKELQSKVENKTITKELAKQNLNEEYKKLIKKEAENLDPDELYEELKDFIAENILTKAEAEKIMNKRLEQTKKEDSKQQAIIEGLEDQKKSEEKGVLKRADEEKVISLVLRTAKAIRVDPVTAFKAMFSPTERIKLTTNQRVVLDRMTLEESAAYKKKYNADTKDWKLDHFIPLQLSGDNSESNLRIISTETWKLYTPVENHLGRLLEDGKISKRQAIKLIKDFKNGEISKEEIFDIN